MNPSKKIMESNLHIQLNGFANPQIERMIVFLFAIQLFSMKSMIHDAFVSIDNGISKSRAYIYNSQLNHQRKNHQKPVSDTQNIDNQLNNQQSNEPFEEIDNTEQTPIYQTESPTHSIDGNSKTIVDDPLFNKIESYVYEIESDLELQPPFFVRNLRLFFLSFRNTNVGKSNDYWEFKGQNGNVTFTFETGLISGIELFKTNRNCEMKYFDILDPDNDYCILKKSHLNSTAQRFHFPIFVRTNKLKLRILENEGDPHLTCLYNYSIFSMGSSTNAHDTDEI